MVMPDPADKTTPARERRRHHAAVAAIVAGVITATVAGFGAMILCVLYWLAGMRENDTRVSQVVFLLFAISGIAMGVGGWRLTLREVRGYRPTVAGALVAFLLAAACSAAWILGERPFIYILGLAVPLVAYGAIAYVLMDCPPDSTDSLEATAEGIEPPSDPPDEAATE